MSGKKLSLLCRLSLLALLAWSEPGARGSDASASEHPSSRQRAPMPTRWMAPPGVDRVPHQPWQADGPFVVRELGFHPVGSAREQGRVAIVVEFDLEPVIGPAVEQYAADLVAKGFVQIISLVSGGTPADLRAYLIQLYSEPAGLAGAIFVGDVP